MGSEYYDIDSILAEHQKLPCILKINAEELGYLEGNSGADLHAGTKLELPFWLASDLAHNDFVEIELPKIYGPRIRTSINASPVSTNFRLLTPYYYIFGIKLVTLVVDDDLTAMLTNAFKVRLKEIMDHTQTGSSHDETEFLQTLDETEKELYKAGQNSSALLRRWYNRGFNRLKSAEVLQKVANKSRS